MKNRGFHIKLFVSLFILLLLFRFLKLEEAYATLRKARIDYLLAVFLIVNTDRVLMAFKWKVLLRAKNLDTPLPTLIKGYYVSTFLGPVLPSTVGEAVVRGVSVSGAGAGSEDIFSSIVIERILGMLSLFFLALVSLGLFAHSKQTILGSLLIYLTIVLILCFIVFYISLEKKISLGMIDLRQRESSSGFVSFMKRVYLSYLDYRNFPSHMILFFILSLVEHLVFVYVNFLIIRSLGFQVSWFSVFCTIPSVLFLSRLPISIGQLGVQEGAYVMLLSMVGLTLTDSVTVSIVRRVVVFLSVLPVFLFILATKQGRGPGSLVPIREIFQKVK